MEKKTLAGLGLGVLVFAVTSSRAISLFSEVSLLEWAYCWFSWVSWDGARRSDLEKDRIAPGHSCHGSRCRLHGRGWSRDSARVGSTH